MSKVIEADFPPRNPEAGSSWLSFMGRPSSNGARRILVVDNDFATTRLIKILLEKKSNYYVLPENDGHSFLAKPINISELVGAIEQHLPHARKGPN